ncbi:MAG: T9SS type A sorting domain-containing protein [Bacteroidales bacterium]|nr:T9SS type A sorting domain-containing protein [Bacteroidales bacterium]MBN2699104.1 T9SS type A sorting domain-containing protein [Bacteroidales bacterium]
MKNFTIVFAIICQAICSLPARSQVWNRQVADSSGNDLGSYCKIALDPLDNPVIVHMDADFVDLRMLERTGNTWNMQIIDTSGYTGWSAGLALDDNGKPHVCFENGTLVLEPANIFGVKYMTLEQDAWIKEDIEECDWHLPMSSTHIALTSAGDPVIGYYNINDEYFYLAFRRDGNWVKKKSPFSNLAIRLRLKSDDTPVVMLETGNTLFLASYDEGTDTWKSFTAPHQPVFFSATRDDTDFVLDENDHVHLTGKFIDMTGFPFVFVKYLHFDWVNWTTETITGSSFETDNGNRIAMDRDGHPAILTLHATEGHLVLFRYDGMAWSYETIDPNCEKFKSADMVFDSNGMPHIVVQAKPEDILSPKEQMVVYYNLVSGLPVFHCNPSTLPFGEVWTESFRILPLTIRNDGGAPLIIGGYELSNTDEFKLEGSSFPAYVQPGDSLELALRFTPAGEVTYTENLRLITNDPGNQLVDIPVTGIGITTGTSSILELHVKDTYVDFTYMEINEEDPLEGVEAGLFRNSTPMAVKQFTNSKGIVLFAGLSPGSCEVQLFKAADQGGGDIDCSRTHSFTLGPGYNSLTLTLADSLFRYQVWLSDTLRQIRETESDLVPYLNYSDAMDAVSEHINLRAGDFHEQHAESLARLMLVEYMVCDLFNEGYRLGSEMFYNFGDLISFVVYSNDWMTSLLDILLGMVQSAMGMGGAQEVFQELMQITVQELIKVEIYNRVTEAVAMAGAEVGPPGDIILMNAWEEVWSEYATGWTTVFGEDQWDNIVRDVAGMLKVPFIQYVYIDRLTAPKIEKGLDYSMDNWYNGTFYDAFMEEVDYVSGEKNSVGMTVEASNVLRFNARLFMITANILGWVGTIKVIPIANILEEISFYMRIAAYVEVVTALGISTGTFFAVPSHMGGTVDDIFFPEGKPKKSALRDPATPQYAGSPANPGHVSRLKASVQSEGSTYSEILLGIKDKVLSGDNVGVASDMILLRDAEKEHNNNILRAASPVMAVASMAPEEIDSFTPMWDSLKSYHAMAGQERFLIYFKLLMAIADSTGASASVVADMIDQNLEADSRLTDHVAGLLDTVTNNMEIPAVLIPSVTGSDKISLALNETGTVCIVVTNTGAVTAENAWLSVSFNEALELVGPDSIYIGSLAPGAETAEIQLVFTCRDEDSELGTWNGAIGSDNARHFSCWGSFAIGEPFTSLPSRKMRQADALSVFPNPVTGKSIISYRLEEKAGVRICLTDLSGRLLHVFTEQIQTPGSYSLPVDWTPFPPGIYTVVLEKNGAVCATKKALLFNTQ